MHRALVSLTLSLAMVPAAYAAKDAWFLDGAGSVELEAAVEVPLFRGGDAEVPLPEIRVTISPEEAEEGEEAEAAPVIFAGIDLSQGWTTVDKDTAEKLGGKVKKSKLNGSSIEVTTLPELILADGLVLRDVHAQVKGDGLVLGLATLEEVAVAILPSTGVVRFVPAGEGEALVSSLGAALPLTAQSGKWFNNGHKTYGNGLTLAADGGMAAHPGLVRLDTTGDRSRYSRFGETPEVQSRSNLVSWACGSIGATQTGKTWLLRDESLVDPEDATSGLFGYDMLYAYDLALNPAGLTLAVKLTDAQRWSDKSEALLQQARDAYAETDEAEDGAEAEAVEVPEGSGEEAVEAQDKGDKKLVGKETALAEALWSAELYDEALEHYKAASDAAGDNCKPHLVYGQRLIASHQAEEAKPLLERAGTLWDQWYSQDLKTRTKLQDEKKADSVESDFRIAQPGACYEAWGELARADLALGDHTAVADLYAAHADLDATLSRVYGLSLIATGDLEAANGPIRRAMNQHILATREDHVALAAVHATPEGEVVFDRQIDRVALPGEGDLPLYMSLVELGRKVGGDAKAKTVADRIAELDPNSPESWIMKGIVGLQQGGEVSADAAKIRELAKVQGARSLNADRQAAYLAIADVIEGKSDDSAAKLADFGGPHTATEVLIAKALLGQATGSQKVIEHVGKCLPALHPEVPLATLDLVSVIPYSGPLAFLEADVIRLWENVQFVTGSADLNPHSSKMLDEVAAIMAEHAELLKVEVAGHTDAQGEPEDNMALSESRAAAVKAYLVGKGISEERLQPVGYGETEPVQSNDTDEGREANRRVEFRIVEKG
ncbi:MAG: OmpA family protein [Deltaproteobacteria bacterium]|nr:OmpA family protein [Deltaproteobacteria bacterium]